MIHAMSAPLLMVAAVVHVLLGPDHYLPLAALAYEFGFSRRKTFLLTMLFGVLHCCIAVALAVGLFWAHDFLDLTLFERQRAWLAGVLLIAAAAWALWVWRRAASDLRSDITQHAPLKKFKNPTMMWLGIFFIVGPCEPLSALVWTGLEISMSRMTLAVNAIVFVVTTVATMVLCVEGTVFGLTRVMRNKTTPAWFRRPVLPLSWTACAVLLLIGL